MRVGRDCIGVSVFALIFNDKNEVLLVNHKKTEKKPKGFSECWSMPGGTVEFGETCVEALRREIKEELGVKIYEEKLINYNDFIFDNKHWTGINFRAKTKDEPRIMEPDKISEIKFFKPNNTPTNLSEFCKECLEVAARN